MGIDRPDWGVSPGGEKPDPSLPATVPAAGRQVTHADWNYQPIDVPSAAAAAEAPQEGIVAGVGYAPSLVEKFSRQPEGFEVHDARLVNAVWDFLESSGASKEDVAAFDALPVSAQTVIYETLWANAGALRSKEQLYAKVKGKLVGFTDAEKVAKLKKD